MANMQDLADKLDQQMQKAPKNSRMGLEEFSKIAQDSGLKLPKSEIAQRYRDISKLSIDDPLKVSLGVFKSPDEKGISPKDAAKLEELMSSLPLARQLLDILKDISKESGLITADIIATKEAEVKAQLDQKDPAQKPDEYQQLRFKHAVLKCLSNESNPKLTSPNRQLLSCISYKSSVFAKVTQNDLASYESELAKGEKGHYLRPDESFVNLLKHLGKIQRSLESQY